MLDNLRSQASFTPDEEEPPEGGQPEAPKPHKPHRSIDQITGTTDKQRLMLAVMLLVMVCLLITISFDYRNGCPASLVLISNLAYLKFRAHCYSAASDFKNEFGDHSWRSPNFFSSYNPAILSAIRIVCLSQWQLLHWGRRRLF